MTSAFTKYHMLGYIPGSFAAHIQLPATLISVMPVKFAHMRLVMVSATVMRAMAALSTKP